MMDPENQDFVAPLSLVPPRRFCCIEHPRVLIMDSPIMTCEPRAYPRQFGASLLQAFQRHIDGPARRDLRFKVRDSATSAMDLFEGLPLGDLRKQTYYQLSCMLTPAKNSGRSVGFGKVCSATFCAGCHASGFLSWRSSSENFKNRPSGGCIHVHN